MKVIAIFIAALIACGIALFGIVENVLASIETETINWMDVGLRMQNVSNPGSPDKKMLERVEVCQRAGWMFAEIADARDKGAKASDLTFSDPGPVTTEAIKFVFSNPKYPPAVVAWYGYGFCMGITSIEDQSA